jgi:hypothetical protein
MGNGPDRKGLHVTILDPTFERFTRSTANVGKAMAPALTSYANLRIGLLANGKRNSEELLDELFNEIARRPELSVIEPVRVRKNSINLPPDAETFRTLARDTDFVLTAVGD